MKISQQFKMLTLCILLSTPMQGLTQKCIDTISASPATQYYRINSNGTVSDNKNKLMWMLCSAGQHWNNGQCLGTARTLTWDNALQAANQSRFAKFSNWRLPTIHELSRITELQCQQPAINLKYFPNTKPLDYWTATSFVNNNDLAWRVHFGFGENHTVKKSALAAVRLVRSIHQ
jgi:hypothetical protein